MHESKKDFILVSINLSEKTGTVKKPVKEVNLIPSLGIEGDAHAGLIEDRQVSLLAMEEIEAVNVNIEKKFSRVLKPGDFAENMTTRGIVLEKLPIGTRLCIGDAVLEVSKIGKSCHAACEIRTLIGDCIMPKKGIFARVIKGGVVKVADSCNYSI